MDEEHPESLLRRALVDADAAAAVALRVGGLPVSEQLTVVFHGRRDLGTIQTYVTHGGHGAGAAVGVDELLRVPCDLDLAGAEDRDEAERLYAEQAAAMRDALVGADVVLDLLREPLEDLLGSPVVVDRRILMGERLPAGRGAPADGDRMRAAGRRADLPAARRPRALPGGLPRRRRRARAPDGRAARPPGGQRAALPRALGRGSRRRARLSAIMPGRCASPAGPGRPSPSPSSCSSGSPCCSPARSAAPGRSAPPCSRSSARRRAATPTLS